MTNNKQQTAVEWYMEKLLDLDYEYAKGLITLGVWSERKNSLIEKAKEMEKEQILDAYECGFESEHDARIPQSSMRYYNETYGGGNK